MQQWAVTLRGRLASLLNNPSRKNIHNLRRSCRVGQSLLDLPGGTTLSSCTELSRVLKRTLRASRNIRNADVLGKFLKNERIGLTDRFPRKIYNAAFRRRLRKYWKNPSLSPEMCVLSISLEIRSTDRASHTSPKEEFETVMRSLKDVYRLWSEGAERDFGHIHELRIRLKMISGRQSVFGNLPAFGPALGEREKRSLELILMLLGRMSDLLMMRGLRSRLSGNKSERKKFLKRIQKRQRQTDKKVLRVLFGGPQSLHFPTGDFSKADGKESDRRLP